MKGTFTLTYGVKAPFIRRGLAPDGGNFAAILPAEDAIDDRQYRPGDVLLDRSDLLRRGAVGDPGKEGPGDRWAHPPELTAHRLDGGIVPLGKVDRFDLGLFVV